MKTSLQQASIQQARSSGVSAVVEKSDDNSRPSNNNNKQVYTGVAITTKAVSPKSVVEQPNNNKSKPTTPKKDENLPKNVAEDPRGENIDPSKRIRNRGGNNKARTGRNTASFDPVSTLVRPDVRIHVGNPTKKTYDKPLKHDDVVIVPGLFADEEDWSLYYKLIEEISELQQANSSKNNNSGGNGNKNYRGGKGGRTVKTDWISWHGTVSFACCWSLCSFL